MPNGKVTAFELALLQRSYKVVREQQEVVEPYCFVTVEMALLAMEDKTRDEDDRVPDFLPGLRANPR